MSMLEVFPVGEFNYKVKGKNMIVDTHKGKISIPLVAFSSCLLCKHFYNDIKEKNACKAFKKGIPDIIFLGENDHKKPYPGDNGIRFEPIEKEDAND